ncbi:hypothetical protein C8J57DRAFT_1249661 [Mycena rebaudengoi]|nr:hypothetical protein C8J57DRAFT_1249661 [Mycena rebaudengoi]
MLGQTVLRALAWSPSLVALVSATCSGPTKNFIDIGLQLFTSVGTCKMSGLEGEMGLRGLAASACNSAQAMWAALLSAEITAHSLACQCKTHYYDTIKTLADVDVWVTCVGPPLTLLSIASKATEDYQDAHVRDVFATCNACTDAQFPPIDAQLEQVKTVLDFVLDWRGELINSMTELLKESIQGVVTAAMFGGGAPNSAPTPTESFIISTITKGYVPPANNKRDLALYSRQSGNSSETDVAVQFMNDTVGIQVQLFTVPVNVSTSALEDQLKAVFASSNFTSRLPSFKANLTGSSYSVVKGNQSAAAASGTASSSPSTTKPSAASRLLLDNSVGLTLFMSFFLAACTTLFS